MRRFTCLSLLCFFYTTAVFSQPEQGTSELSFAFSFQARNAGGKSYTFFNLPFRYGYFITQRIEIEPEVIYTKAEGLEPGFTLLGNISYHFLAEPNAFAFVLLGGGVSNSIPTGWSDLNVYEDLTLAVLNIGLGVKTFVSKKGAVRAEYRFQHFSGENTTGGG